MRDWQLFLQVLRLVLGGDWRSSTLFVECLGEWPSIGTDIVALFSIFVVGGDTLGGVLVVHCRRIGRVGFVSREIRGDGSLLFFGSHPSTW